MLSYSFNPPLVKGKLIKRYKRFLADIQLEDGQIVTAHCTNSGSMLTCLEPNAPVFLTPTNDPNRKTRFTWEMIEIDGNWVGINTSIPNQIVEHYLKQGIIPSLGKWDNVIREFKVGNSRLDFYAERENEKCFIEVKNVTLKDDHFARFPDAKTTRGLKHLNELFDLSQKGFRSVILFIVQRTDVSTFSPAWTIDPEYSAKLLEVCTKGVEAIAFQVKVGPSAIEPLKEMPIML